MQQLTYAGLTVTVSDAVWERLELVLDVVDLEMLCLTKAFVGYLPGSDLPTHVRVRLVARVPWHVIDVPDDDLPAPLGDDEVVSGLNDWLVSRARRSPDTTGTWLEIKGFRLD